MEIVESLVIDRELSRLEMFEGGMIDPYVFSLPVLSISATPGVGWEYRDTWNAIGWMNQYLRVSESGEYRKFRSEKLLKVDRQIVQWGTEGESYQVSISFVPWLTPTRIRIWEVSGFPELCCGFPLNPLDSQQQFSPTYPTGQSLVAYSVVRVSGGQLFYADASNVSGAFSTLGLITSDVVSGASSQALTEGVVSNPAWNWFVGEPLWVGSSGQIVQTPPTSGFLQQVGTSIAQDTIRFELQESILL